MSVKILAAVIKRNIKLFFKDKGMFFTALITPAILLVLYATFLGNVYRDSFMSALPAGFEISKSVADGFMGGQLISSILAVSCVTVPFCSNMLMVQDKANGTIKDLSVSSARPSVLAMGYYLATLASSLIICLCAMGLCIGYTAIIGFYMSAIDIVLLTVDVFLLVMFGTALSSIINFFLSTQGQISAVGTIISSGYGFICGAYMPISQFSQGLQRVISFLPGTYGTALVRNHAMRGVFEEMKATGLANEAVEGIRDGIDCNLYFFDSKVEAGAMYAILGITVAVLIVVYVLMNTLKKAKK